MSWISRLPPGAEQLPTASAFNRRVLDIMAVFNVVTQAVLVTLLLLGERGHGVLPLAGGAAVAMFLLAYFYGRWLLPVLRRRHVLALIVFKELAVMVVLGLVAALAALLHWLF